jgi:quercetin dioxygenase-like cupin family protein
MDAPTNATNAAVQASADETALPFQFSPDLIQEVEIPKDGITSRALYSDAGTRVVVFGFDEGQELSEHTAAVPAILHILSGEAVIGLGSEERTAGPGSWAFMEANLPHSIVAKTRVVMLLTLLKSAKP